MTFEILYCVVLMIIHMGIKENKMDENIPLKLAISVLLFTGMVLSSIFPYGALEMIEIGEETGKTSLILKKLAEFYEEEVTNVAENLSAIIEPVLIVIIGAVVGVFAVSIIGPLYSVLGTIQ